MNTKTLSKKSGKHRSQEMQAIKKKARQAHKLKKNKSEQNK